MEHPKSEIVQIRRRRMRRRFEKLVPLGLVAEGTAGYYLTPHGAETCHTLIGLARAEARSAGLPHGSVDSIGMVLELVTAVR